MLKRIKTALAAQWRAIDPKLKYTVLTFAISRLALEAGISWDPTTETIISGLLASAVGYAKSNAATILRTPQESGNAGMNPEAGSRPEPLDP